MAELPDSGLRTSFQHGGAVREADPDKPLVEAISPYALMRLGLLLAKADKKYADAGGCRNWEKGMPITRYIGAIIRHALLYMMRDRKEDHAAAIMWNAMCVIHHEEIGALGGVTFDDLDDRPRWSSPLDHPDEEITGQARAAAFGPVTPDPGTVHK